MGKVKIGFIGVGGIGSVHVENVSKIEDAEIVAICDVNAENAAKKAQELGLSRFYTDVDDLLESEALDGVFICVPPFAHGDIEEKVVKKGIHLLVEKPVSLNLVDAYSKLETINNSGVINASGYCLRYIDVLDQAKTYLSDKKIAMVRGHYLSSFVPTPWFREKDKSGGQIVEQATHVVDLIRYLAGDINGVYADMHLDTLKDIEGINIPDVSSVNVTFDSGAIGHLDSTLIQPDHRAAVELLGLDYRVEVSFTSVTITEKGKEKRVYTADSDFYYNQDAAFIKAIQEKDQSLILANFEEGVKTLAVTLAANKSAETSERVNLDTFTEAQLMI